MSQGRESAGPSPGGPGQRLCLGMLAHVDAGKTTLSEALLYQTGTIRALGRVDHRDAFLDTEDLEREREDHLENGQIHDENRIAYLKSHIEQMMKAVDEDGVDRMGYTVWGCIDPVSFTTGANL